MREALGLVEIRGLATAILVSDAMVKTANINIIGLENTKGLGYMTIKVCGDVGAVTAAVTCGKQIAIENNSLVSAKVIPRPSNSIEVTFCQLNNKKDDANLKKEDVPKENTIIENNNINNEESIVEKDNTNHDESVAKNDSTNNEENVVEKDNVINGDCEKEEKELLNNPMATSEKLEDREEASAKKEETQIKQSSSEHKVSNSQNNKKSRNKKVETEKKE